MSKEIYGDEPGTSTSILTTNPEDAMNKPANHSDGPDATDMTPTANEILKAQLADFLAYMPTHSYIHIPTGNHWPATSIDGSIPKIMLADGTVLRPSAWLDKHHAVVQQVWDPGKPQIITDLVMNAASYTAKPGAALYNRYVQPSVKGGDPSKAVLWREHLELIYPEDHEHIENYFAFKLQFPGKKINHALVLGGSPGIGKDTILEPIKYGVGANNWNDISPQMLYARFNGWAKSVMLRISEASDMGANSISFYEESKTLFAGPPDVIRIDEKNIQEYYVANVCGVVITTNNRTNGLYIPADDRRHYVAWSDTRRDHFASDYWDYLYHWMEHGGKEHVVAYLQSKDLSKFDAKAPPPKTPAFWIMVQANEPPDSGDLREAIDLLGSPDALRLIDLKRVSEQNCIGLLPTDLVDKKQTKSWAPRLERVGYVVVRNPNTKDGLFSCKGKYFTVYTKKELSYKEQLKAAQSLV